MIGIDELGFQASLLALAEALESAGRGEAPGSTEGVVEAVKELAAKEAAVKKPAAIMRR